MFGIEQQLAKKIILRYSQRWISYFENGKLMFIDDRSRPRHLSTGKCLCQFIEEHFKNAQKCDENENETEIQDQEQKAYNKETKITYQTDKKLNLLYSYSDSDSANNHKQHKAVEETLVKPLVIRKCASMAPTIPTLSGLVSLKENSLPEHLRIDMGPSYYSHYQTNNNYYNYSYNLPKILEAEQKQQQHQHQLQRPPDGVMLNLSAQPLEGTKEHYNQVLGEKEHLNQSPASSPDVSLRRSDDLVRKLRLLLELRQNELQGIDGSLFSGLLYKSSHNYSDNFGLNHQVNQVQAGENGTTNTFAVNNKSSSSTINSAFTCNESEAKINKEVPIESSAIKGPKEAKKFYSQGEGLFFLSSNGAKKSQQVENRNNRILEIC